MNTQTLSTISLASGSTARVFHRQAQRPHVQGAHTASRGQRQHAVVSYSVPEEPHCEEKKDFGIGRRASLSSTAALAAAALMANPTPALAADSASTYLDAVDKWSMEIPKGWELGVGTAEGSAATRRVVAFFPEGSAAAINVTVVCTNVGADFTKMGSFGTPYEFGTRLVGSLDRSNEGKKPKFMVKDGPNEGIGQRAKLIAVSSANDLYNVEYTLEKPNEFNRHLFQVVGLSFNGMYNRLYTVTGQAPEENVEEVRKTLETILASFKPPQQ